MTYEVGFWTATLAGFCSFIACLICAKFFLPNYDENSKRSQSNFFWFFFTPLALPIVYDLAVGIKLGGVTVRETIAMVLSAVVALLFALRKR